MDFEEFLWNTQEYFDHHYGKDLSNDQIDWLQIIYDEYKDDDGYIDWSDHSHDSAWYYYLSEVLDIPDDVIDRYSED